MQLVIYDQLYIDKLVRKRSHEIKLGERVKTLPWNCSLENLAQSLTQSSAKYVLLGLPEDIGVRANHGRGGAYSAWQPALSTFLNSQSNAFLTGDEILVLGHIDFTKEMNQVKDFDFHDTDNLVKSREIVSQIDDFLSPLIQLIVESGKEIIAIGGGHNNAYPLIKGCALGLKTASINVINCDAHSDFRPLEGRHSGNGFSYAFAHGFLHKYFVIGLQENFNTDAVMQELFKQEERTRFITFEDIFVREEYSFIESMGNALHFTKGAYCGLEIDMDTIQNIPSSAKTSSGISTIEARKYIHKIASSAAVVYLHIAEAAPVLSHLKTDLKTGKLITYLVSDYIKARNKVNQ